MHRDQLKEITEKLDKGVAEIFSSGKYADYLRAMSHLHDYSFSNIVLILMQKPDATMVAGMHSWNKNYGRFVNEGERGIKILAPAPYKREILKTVFDNDGNPVLDKDGNEVKEKVAVMVENYKIAYVYDVSQTHGRPVPSLGANELYGEVKGYDRILNAVKAIAPVPVFFEEIKSEAKGYYSPVDDKIVIKKDLSEVQTIKTLLHESAHALLDHGNKKKDPDYTPDRSAHEVQAESVAFTVCSYYGIDTSDYSFGYIAGWMADMDAKTLRRSMKTIIECSAEIIQGMNRVLLPEKTMGKERETENDRVHIAVRGR